MEKVIQTSPKTELLNGIKAENPEIWTPEFQQQMIDRVREAVEAGTLSPRRLESYAKLRSESDQSGAYWE